MNASTQNIDLPQLYAKYAATQNISQVARDFGISRFQVKRLWSNLCQDEQNKYLAQIAASREEALQQYAEQAKEETIDYLGRVERVKSSLLSKLEDCVATILKNDPNGLSKIKDATAALKNLHSVSQDAAEPEMNFYEKYTSVQKIIMK